MREARTIGQFLKQWRERSGLSQEEIARRTRHKGKGKWTKSYISLVENDRASTKGAPPRPSPEKLKAICEVMGAPLEKAIQLAYGNIATPESAIETARSSNSASDLLKQLSDINALVAGLPPERRDDVLAIVQTLYQRYTTSPDESVSQKNSPGNKAIFSQPIEIVNAEDLPEDFDEAAGVKVISRKSKKS